MRGNTTPLEVRRRRDEHTVVRTQSTRDQTGVGQRSDTKRKIDPFFYQVHESIGQADLDVELWKDVQQFVQQRRHEQLTEDDRNTHPQVSARTKRRLLDLGLGVRQVE